MRIATCILLVCFIMSCNYEDKQNLNRAIEANPDSTLSKDGKYFYENSRIIFGEELSVASSARSIVPVSLDEKYVETSYMRGKKENYTSFNIAVIDSSHQFEKYLFDESVVIENISTYKQTLVNHLGSSKKDSLHGGNIAPYTSLLFFNVWKFKNKKRDYKRLYIYDLKKDVLRQLSPDEAAVLYWRYYKNRHQLMIYCLFDSDQNGEIDQEDDQNIVIVDLRKVVKPAFLFTPQDLNQLRLQVAKEN